MPWPLSQDYNEAIQNPAHCFVDPELRQGEAETNALGLPAPRSGNFADVYAVVSGAHKWAVKCFTRQIPGLQERYQQISLHLAQVKLPFMVDFTFQERGIRVRGEWYPILKMQWVEGFTLNQFVKAHLEKPQTLELLSQLWIKLAGRLREANIAHCDLQHGNVLLVPASRAGTLQIKLVDYDGMCVPSLTLLKSIEVGHPAFQHPQRQREGIYSLEVDRFSHLVIYTALRSLISGGKALWSKHDDGDNLLFRPSDYQAPNKSRLCHEILTSNGEGRKLVQVLMHALSGPLDQVPLLQDLVGAGAAAAAPPARPSKLHRTEPPPTSAAASAPPKPAAPSHPAAAGMVTPVPQAADAFATELGTVPLRRSTPQKKRMLAPLVAAGVLVLCASAGVAWFLMRDNSAPNKEQPPTVAQVKPEQKDPTKTATQTAQLPVPTIPSKKALADAVLTIHANEPTPEVFVDDVKIGTTWLTEGKRAEIRLQPGTRKVVVKKDGFTDSLHYMPIEPAGSYNLTVYLVKNQTASKDSVLNLRVSEAYPDILVDGQVTRPAWGKTGKTGMVRVPSGTRTVIVLKEGFKTHKEVVTLEQGENRLIQATLEKIAPPSISPATARELKADLLPVPPQAELDAAFARIKQDYKKEYDAPKRPDSLSTNLFREAQKLKDDPPRKFVLLREARDFAAADGELDLALQAIHEMATDFAIDTLLEDKTSALLKTAKRTRAKDLQTLIKTTIQLVDEATEAEKYDAAKLLVTMASSKVGKIKDLPPQEIKALQKEIQARSLQVTELRKDYARMKDTIQKLQENPEDQALNLEVGRYRFFRKKEREKGLPLLAKGSDPVLADLARKELQHPTAAADCVELGNGWRKLGNDWKKRTDSKAKQETTEVKRRAYYWYLQALPTLEGQSLSRVTGAMEALAKEVPKISRPWEHFDISQAEEQQEVLLLRPGKSILSRRQYDGYLRVSVLLQAQTHSFAIGGFKNASVEFKTVANNDFVHLLFPPRVNYQMNFGLSSPLLPRRFHLVEWEIAEEGVYVQVNGKKIMSQFTSVDVSQKAPIRISAPRGLVAILSVGVVQTGSAPGLPLKASAPSKGNLTSKGTPTSFYFDYTGDPEPGKRLWRRLDDRTWTETYPSGKADRFRLVGPATVDGIDGLVVEREPDGVIRVFIPDLNSTRMQIRFQRAGKEDTWGTLGTMKQVQ